MFGGHNSSSGDLFEIVRRAGGNGGSMADVLSAVCSSSCATAAAVLPPPQIPLVELPPSEEEMAAWLCQIVQGDELEGSRDLEGGEVAGRTPVDGKKLLAQAKQKTEKLQTSMEGNCAEDTTRSNSSERRKKTTAGTRKSHNSETHSLTEKKRRCKINERIKTLQQLVPGCDKCNQASTLEQTVQYMKSLQQQIQAIKLGRSMKPASAIPGAVVLGPPPGIVPLAPLLPVAHYPAIVLPAAPMDYPNAALSPARPPPPQASIRKSSN